VLLRTVLVELASMQHLQQLMAEAPDLARPVRGHRS
jgi:hypothetical protein